MVPVEIIKNWMYEYRELSRDIENAEQRLDTLESQYMSPSSTNITGMPRGNGDPADKIGKAVAHMEEIRDKIRRLLDKQEELRHDIQAAEELIIGRGYADRRAVIEFRYIFEMNWADVSVAVFGNEEKFYGHEESYLRKCMKLHGFALSAIGSAVSEGDFKTLDECIKKYEELRGDDEDDFSEDD